MWTTILLTILPMILPSALKLIAFLYDQKVLTDQQRKTFLDFIQAMSEEQNESRVSRDVFKKLHDKLKDQK